MIWTTYKDKEHYYYCNIGSTLRKKKTLKCQKVHRHRDLNFFKAHSLVTRVFSCTQTQLVLSS